MGSKARKGGRRGRKARGGNGLRSGRTAPTPLLPGGETSPRLTRYLAQQRVRMALRRQRVVHLYTHEGLSMHEIQRQLAQEGIVTTTKTVCTDIHAVMRESLEYRVKDIELLREIEDQRLEETRRSVLPGLRSRRLDDRLKTASTIGALHDKRVRLFGLTRMEQAAVLTLEQFAQAASSIRQAYDEAIARFVADAEVRGRILAMTAERLRLVAGQAVVEGEVVAPEGAEEGAGA